MFLFSAGKSMKIKSEILEIVDEDNPEAVIIRIASSPKYGLLTNSQRPGAAISDFSVSVILRRTRLELIACFGSS